MTTWKYDDGTWAEIADPVEIADGEDVHAAYKRAGYELVSGLGWPAFENADIWQWRPRAAESGHWLIAVTIGDYGAGEIVVDKLPDLIGILSQLSSYATATMLSVLTQHLEDLIYNVSDDETKERNRRYPAPKSKS
jgi:hypothetical protein